MDTIVQCRRAVALDSLTSRISKVYPHRRDLRRALELGGEGIPDADGDATDGRRVERRITRGDEMSMDQQTDAAAAMTRLPLGGAQLRVPVGEADHAQGPVDASVTLVEYGDYQCPYCGRAYPIVKALQQRLGNRLRFVFRNFPITQIHPYALHAAEAAESAGALGGESAFWAMHDALFEHQQDSSVSLTDSKLSQYATTLGIDADRVAGELEAGTREARVHADFMGGIRSGVNGTPTFFVNGTRFDGDWSDVDEFAKVLEHAAGGRPAGAGAR
jgi:protein-disulfide isomerase